MKVGGAIKKLWNQLKVERGEIMAESWKPSAVMYWLQTMHKRVQRPLISHWNSRWYDIMHEYLSIDLSNRSDETSLYCMASSHVEIYATWYHFFEHKRDDLLVTVCGWKENLPTASYAHVICQVVGVTYHHSLVVMTLNTYTWFRLQ